MIFWKECSDLLGSAVVASVMFKSLARKAKLAKEPQLADELATNAGLVIVFGRAELNSCSGWVQLNFVLQLMYTSGDNFCISISLYTKLYSVNRIHIFC